MGRALLGLIKGLLVGGGVGYALLQLGLSTGLFAYLACGLVGATVGLVCGRAPWRAETIWTPVLKMVFGFGVSVGLYALGSRYLPGHDLTLARLLPAHLPDGLGGLALGSGPVLAPAIGVVYGTFVEIDDGGAADKERLEGRKQQKSLPRPSAKSREKIVD